MKLLVLIIVVLFVGVSFGFNETRVDCPAGYEHQDSENFRYCISDKSLFSIQKSLRILEGSLQEYQKLFGGRSPSKFFVIESIGQLGAQAVDRRSIELSLPPNFTNEGLFNHFLAHELFHFWVGGYVKGEKSGDAIEGLTQVFANMTLVRLGVIPKSFLNEEIAKRKIQLHQGIAVNLNEYYLKFDRIFRSNEKVAFTLARKLSNRLKSATSPENAVKITDILSEFL